ncbi:PLP-dependent aminotransferase family protein [Petrotoga olearia]|uniref:Aspartate aminotransferase n=2 Tax=Petrotoga olearia TaxID=156203 RepID=A0A2K1NZX9_9BACT|nr:PLP-dependent aminotransferase family protein [Petrotoga olearia]PNR96095.1 aspartate aminotransferase [Petrotoga olearia DSM 13574]RMA71530.1 2-aminoadipate transaminase [Petrotoga olearia]
MENIYSNRMKNVPRSFIREILKVIDDPEIISFAGGLPNADLFPIEEIKNAAVYQFDNSGKEILQYSTTEGYPPLREFIANRYNEKKGLNITQDDVLITHGSQQALDLLGKLFLNADDFIAIEEPGYLGAIQALSVYTKNFKPVKLCLEGLDLVELKDVLEEFSPKLLYTVPNFQNPSGITYTNKNREKIAEILKNHNIYLIEDDPYGELRFEGEDNVSFKKLIPEQTILLGSFSKIVAPGFRLGWVVAPKDVLENLVTAKQGADLHSNYVGQRIIYQFLKENDLDKHIINIKTRYGSQKNAMIKSIKKYFPKNVEYTDPQGGMFLWITLPNNISALELFDKAIEKKVAFVPGDPFYINKNNVNTLRLNYSCANEKNIEEGIKRLTSAIQELVI